MRHQRLVSTFAGAAALSLVAAGCSSGTGGEDDGPVTLTMAAVTFTESGRGEALTEWVNEFNDSQDRITIEPVGIPFSTFSQTVLTQIAGGEGPDLIRFDISDFVEAASAGLLEPLGEHLDMSQYELLEGPDEYNFVDDTRYGVTFDVANYALIYNTDLVDSPPETYEELMSTAEELTDGTTYGMAFRQTKEQEPGMFQDLFNYVYGFGGSFSDGSTITLNSPEVIEGLNAYEELYDAEVIPVGADAATYRRMFSEGLIGMMIDNGGVPSIVLGSNPDLNIAAAPNPFPVQSQGGIITPFTVNSASDHVDEAVTFIEWMLQDEQQQQLQEIMGAESVATVTERPDGAVENAPYLEVFDSLTDTTQPQVVAGFEEQTPELRTIIVDAVLSALHNEQTMQEAMDAAQQQAEELVG